MRSRSTLVAVVAATTALVGLATPGSAVGQRAAHSSGNLIRNASAEKTTPAPSPDGMAKVALAHWKVKKSDKFTAVRYGTDELTADSAGPSGRGKNYFAGGSDGKHSIATQSVSLKPYAAWIKAGAHFRLTGWLGGWESQRDSTRVTVVWLNRSGKSIGSASIGPVTAKDRKSKTVLLKRSKAGAVPGHAVKARVTITMTRVDGTYSDGYADKLKLVVTKG
jgi:hypothetical protein